MPSTCVKPALGTLPLNLRYSTPHAMMPAIESSTLSGGEGHCSPKLRSQRSITLSQDAEASAMYEELLRKLQDSRAEAQAFVRVSHFIMDEALSKKESLNAHAHS